MRKVRFVVQCSDDERKKEPATYKIAAEWIGGGYSELKTFGFADDVCLERVYRKAVERVEKFKPTAGEQLGELHVFRLDPGQHDYELTRLPELEVQLRQMVAEPTAV